MRIIFFGTPEFSAHHLTSLLSSENIEVAVVVTNPDKAKGRGGKCTGSPVKEVAEKNNIPILQPPGIKKNLQQFLSDAQAYGPFDIGVVVAFGQLLPEEVLKLPKAGCVNVHASLLPRWRGAAPIQRAIMAGDKKTGVCLMQMEKGLDTGAVYSSEAIEICDTDTSSTLYEKLWPLGAKLLTRDLQKIVDGKIIPVPQSEEGVLYAHKIPNDECQINWEESAIEVKNQIQGLSSFPGAFSTIHGKRLKIYAAMVIDRSYDMPPGTVVTAEGRDLWVACGEGTLSILEVQLEGKKRLPVPEFLKGGGIASGDRF